MKLNIAAPTTGAQKLIEVDDERKLRHFYDKRISQEVDGEALGDEYKGYVFRISGGNDKQGFAMKQGVLVNGRVRLLLSEGHSTYRPRRDGERKRKSVRGCIVGADLAVLNLVIVKKGAGELPGLTDKYIPRRLGPKRASKIRKLFNLTKQDDVRQYVIRRELPAKEGKKKQTKAPKIQRLVTPLTLQRKRHRLAIKKRRAEKSKSEAAEYEKLLAQRKKETRDRRHALLSKKRGVSQRESTKKPSTKEPAQATKSAGAAKPAATQPAAKAAAAGAKLTKRAPAEKKEPQTKSGSAPKVGAKDPVKTDKKATQAPKKK